MLCITQLLNQLGKVTASIDQHARLTEPIKLIQCNEIKLNRIQIWLRKKIF